MNIVLTGGKKYEVRGKAWIKAAEDLAKAQIARKMAQEFEEKCTVRLKEMTCGIASKGGGFVYDFIVRKGAVDYAVIPELQEVDLERYRKGGVEVWKLSMELEV